MTTKEDHIQLYKVTLIFYLPTGNGFKYTDYKHTTTRALIDAATDANDGEWIVVIDLQDRQFTYSTKYLHSVVNEPINAD